MGTGTQRCAKIATIWHPRFVVPIQNDRRTTSLADLRARCCLRWSFDDRTFGMGAADGGD
jgi:hypothetical protein